jgi:hypothetical protein
MERRPLSTVIVILNALIAELVVVLFLQDYWAVAAVSLALASLLFRSGAVVVVIEFLVALVVNFWMNGQAFELKVTLGILSVPVLAQLVYFAAEELITNWEAPLSSYVQNLIFAVIGQAGAISLYSLMHISHFRQGSGGIFGALQMFLLGIPTAKLEGIVSVLQSGPSEEALFGVIRIGLNSICLGLLMSPWIWGPFFAVLRQERFRLARFSSIVGRTIVAILVNSMVTFVVVQLVSFLLYGIAMGIVAFRPSWIEELSWVQNLPSMSDVERATIMGTVLLLPLYLARFTVIAFVSAWVAQWGRVSHARSV